MCIFSRYAQFYYLQWAAAPCVTHCGMLASELLPPVSPTVGCLQLSCCPLCYPLWGVCKLAAAPCVTHCGMSASELLPPVLPTVGCWQVSLYKVLADISLSHAPPHYGRSLPLRMDHVSNKAKCLEDPVECHPVWMKTDIQYMSSDKRTTILLRCNCFCNKGIASYYNLLKLRIHLIRFKSIICVELYILATGSFSL